MCAAALLTLHSVTSEHIATTSEALGRSHATEMSKFKSADTFTKNTLCIQEKLRQVDGHKMLVELLQQVKTDPHSDLAHRLLMVRLPGRLATELLSALLHSFCAVSN